MNKLIPTSVSLLFVTFILSCRYEEKVNALKKQLNDAELCSDISEKEKKKRIAEKQLHDLQKDMQNVQIKQQELEKKERVSKKN